METPWFTNQYVTRGWIQHVDDLINSSAIPNANKVLLGIMATILEASRYDGKHYAIP